MNKFIVAAYATKDTQYEQVAREYLLPSLINFNIEFDFQLIPSFGSWQLNTSYKPTFALKNLYKHSGKDILLIDVDARIEKPLDLFNNIPEKYNFAAHFLKHKDHYGTESTKVELLTGSLWIRNTERSKQICEYWQANCERSSEWEQSVLQKELVGHNEPVYNLPVGFAYITNLPNGKDPHTKCEDVYIRHYQKSRELKKTIK